MLRQRTRTLQATMATADALATVAAFFVAYYGAGVLPQQLADAGVLQRLIDTGLLPQALSQPKTILPLARYLWVLAVSMPMWWVLFGLFGCYDFSPLEKPGGTLRRMARPMLTGTLAVSAVIFFSKELLFARRVIGAFLLCNVGFLLAGRSLVLLAAARLHRASGAMRHILVVGAGESAREFGATVQHAGWGLNLLGYVAPSSSDLEPSDADYLGTIEELPQILDERGVDDVVLAEHVNDLGDVQRVIHACEEVGAAIHFAPRFFDARISRPHVETFGGIPMLTFTTTPYTPLALGIKRAADILFGLALMAVSAIPMILIAIVIKASSPGRAIFKQTRSGLYGREFTLYKFRSMIADAERQRADLESVNEMDGPVFKMRSDPRITGFGGFLRRYSLDELPQLWNVLKGDMSLIGPRPPLPDEVRKYERWQRRRLSMRPGLSCIWQVTDRNLATFEKWMEYDLQYIDNWSLWLDLKIALRTLPAMLKGTGI